MKRILLVCGVLAVISAAHARPPKKPAAPAAPVETYDVSDIRLGEAMDAVCLKTPMKYEPYDGRDNLLIVGAADESSAFLQLSGDCKFNTLMFAASIAPKTADGCVKAGDALVVNDSFGASRECEIKKINKWNPDATYLENFDQ